MSTKKVKLDIQHPPYALIAISCSETLHRLSWLINSNLGIQLSESLSIKFPIKKGFSDEVESLLEFPTHKDEGSFPDTTIVLIKNRFDAQLLFKELPNVDYILQIKGAQSENYIMEIVPTIKMIPSLLAAIAIDSKKLSRIQLI